jgi:protease I
MSKVAFLLASGFEDSEMKVPYDEVLQAGHQAEIIGLNKNETLLGKKGSVSYAAIKRSAR